MSNAKLVEYWMLLFAAFVNASALLFARFEEPKFYMQLDISIALIVLTLTLCWIVIRIAKLVIEPLTESEEN